MDQPMPKRPRSSSQPPEAHDTLFYLIYELFGGSPDSYSFYKIDLCEGSSGSDERKPLPHPLMLLDAEAFPHGMSFLKVEQEILMFGSQLSRDVLVFDTSKDHSLDPGTFVTKFPPMLAGKVCPIALTVGGTIYVFSGSFNPYYSYEQSPRFEAFDTERQSWIALPDPPVSTAAVAAATTTKDNYEILAYATVHDSKIIVSMPIGIFMYSVSGEVGWRMLTTTFGGVDRFPFCQGAEYVNGMWYALEGYRLRAYDFTNIDGGLINTHDVFSMECDSELVTFRPSTLVFSMGCDMLGVVRSGFDNPAACSNHVVFQLFKVANPKEHKFLLTQEHHPVTFFMEYRLAKWGAVTACFPMKK